MVPKMQLQKTFNLMNAVGRVPGEATKEGDFDVHLM